MSLIAELRRRNVFKVAVAYVIVSWLTIQVIDVLVPMMALPDWIGRALVLVLIVGFPVAIVFAWAFELTPEGIKLEKDVDRSQSITVSTGRKLDLIIIAVLTVAVVVFAVDKFVISADSATSDTVPAARDVSLQDLESLSPKTVAVIPFEDMSPNQDQTIVGEAIATELMTELSKRSDLQLLSRSSSFAIPEEVRTSQEIGRYLGVDILVEGTVRQIGDRIRVTAQLVSVADGYQLWADVYESQMAQDFSVEVAIAEFFSGQVRAQLAAPFRPGIQLVDFAQSGESTFESLIISSAAASDSSDSTAGLGEGETDAQ